MELVNSSNGSNANAIVVVQDRGACISRDGRQEERHNELLEIIDIGGNSVLYPVHLLPRADHSDSFYGRDEVFAQMDAALDGSGAGLRSVLLHGLGGVGKTETALTYAHRRSANYSAIFWIRSETSSSRNASITEIAKALDLPGANAKSNEEGNLWAFKAWLRRQANMKERGKKWLIIFDNVESICDIDNHVPVTAGSIIITSRRADSELPDTKPIHLKPFPEEDATQILKQALKSHQTQLRDEADEKALASLSASVGGLPLGLRAIAGLMNARKDETASTFLSLFNENSREMFKEDQRTIGYDADKLRVAGKEHVLDKVWHVSFTQLEEAPRILLGILALLSPDSIPLSLFGDAAALQPPVERVRSVCGVSNYRYLFEMTDHKAAIWMVEIALQACAAQDSELYAHLLNTLGASCFELNDLRRCRESWVKALKIRRTWASKGVPGGEEELANQLSNMGNLESAEGNLDQALDYLNSAKEIRIRMGEPEIIPLAVSHMNTGRAYFLKGMYEEALSNYGMAADIFVAKSGTDAHFMAHLNYAHGNLERSRGASEAAADYYDRACKILEQDAPLHLSLAACYYKKACLLSSEKSREEALQMLDKGLVIAEFRAAEPDIARIKMKKVEILKQGSSEDQQDAETLYKQTEIILANLPEKIVLVEEQGEEQWNSWVCPYWR